MSSILCIGNFGTGKKQQYDIAELMLYLCSTNDCKLILGLGNNIMPEGVESIDDNQFLEKFEIPYKLLPNNIKFYNILGNRDYFLKNSPQTQINYSNQSLRWILPHNFYCFIKKFNQVPVEFMAIDTNLSKLKNRILQEQWAINTLLESKARWRVVFGHHPWKYFNGNTTSTCSSRLDDFYQNIVDTNKVDIIISGHYTSQQHIYIPKKPHMIISGVGYTSTSKSGNGDIDNILLAKELRFSSSEPGCVKIDIKRNCLTISFINTKKIVLNSFKIKKY